MSERDTHGVEAGQMRKMPQGRDRWVLIRVERVSGSMATLELAQGRGAGAKWMWSTDIVARATELVEG